ncbi:hypothetical protein F5I97DRAFT_102558 [Phlebopus sp. FC_14]|nr:hypothetical protein F5I97DRAFT_102558 [Phlebopus sp. FC_14]
MMGTMISTFCVVSLIVGGSMNSTDSFSRSNFEGMRLTLLLREIFNEDFPTPNNTSLVPIGSGALESVASRCLGMQGYPCQERIASCAERRVVSMRAWGLSHAVTQGESTLHTFV